MSRGKLFSIKSRISSTNSIFDLSKAMGLVSSSKFSSLQHTLGNATNYNKELENIISNISLSNKKNNNSIFIVVASDKGLCGSYNNNIVRVFKEYYEDEAIKQFSGNNKVLLVGKKIASYMKKNFEISHIYSSLDDTFKLASDIFENILSNKIENLNVFMIYTDYKVSKTNIIVENLFPNFEEKRGDNTKFTFETSKEKMFEKIFPIYLKFKIYRNILSALASENYSRMVAMKNASDNAEDLMKNLKRFYNKERQSIITQEILEVVSGSENSDEI